MAGGVPFQVCFQIEYFLIHDQSILDVADTEVHRMHGCALTALSFGDPCPARSRKYYGQQAHFQAAGQGRVNPPGFSIIFCQLDNP